MKKPGQVVVVGAGLAGLAASAMLSHHGLPVILLESRPKIGGRADSYRETASGELVDHCQHISMGCCSNLKHFCQWMGVEHLFREEPSLYFMTPDRVVSHFCGNSLPAPIHLARSFLQASFLSLGEKIWLGIALTLLRFAKHEEDEPFLDWLRSHFQTERVIERFWKPVLVSALNTPIEKASFQYARKVMVDSFFQSNAAYRLKLPTVPLGELFGDNVLRKIRPMGVRTLLGHPVKKVLFADGIAKGVLLQDDQQIGAQSVILATPFQRTFALLEDCLDQGVSHLKTAPITSVHVWLNGKITDLPHVVMLDSLSHWLFYRGENKQREHLYQVVISASASTISGGHEKIQQQVLGELGVFFSGMADAKVLRCRVVTEKKATFVSTPRVDDLRPGQRTKWPNLFLAGDYTRTNWPATMEGAVRSGYLAAEALLRGRGIRVRCLQPDLNGSISVDEL